MQKHANRVDLVKSFPTSISLRNSALIQPRTSLEVWRRFNSFIYSPPYLLFVVTDDSVTRRRAGEKSRVELVRPRAVP